MSIVNHNVVKAHSFARQAEEAMENKQWNEAVQLHQQAADLFMLATQDTQDLESIKALQLLSTAQANKSRALQRQIQHFQSNRTPNTLSSSPRLERQVVSEPMDDISLSNSQTCFKEQELLSHQRRPSLSKITQEERKSSSGSDLWSWVERTLEILMPPDTSHRSPRTTPADYKNRTDLNQSTLMSSFYFVPEEPASKLPAESDWSADVNSTEDFTIPTQSVSSTQELQQKIKELEKTLAVTVEENTLLKKKLKQVYSQGMEVTRENDYMKKSILHFKQEFQQKAHQFRDLSSSLGNLTPLPSQKQQREKELENTITFLQSQVSDLTKKLETVTETARQQSLLLRRSEDRESFDRGHRYDHFSSSPPTEMYGSPSNLDDYVPDPSLTLSQILH